ncbi:MAG: heme/copper-type cytochrome/quinol oxidase subunit 3 [Acidimicrobiales bacterium]|jgi:heme/copper-type cytochrome/quinol oxidase subunit 3
MAFADVIDYDAINHPVLPESAAAPHPTRPRLLLIGSALASLAVVMGFSALVGLYLSVRADVIASGEQWLPNGVDIPLTQPNMMMFTLVFSVATLAWATSAMRADDRPNSYIAIGLSVLFGFAFLAQTAFLLSIMELEIAADGRAPLIYAVIGTHMVLVIAAMTYLAAMALRALGGDYSAKDLEGLYGASMFWYTTVGLYLVLWYAIYITK